jgi:hypothetical protein
VEIYHILLIHPSVDRNLGCFCFLAIMNNSDMDLTYRFLYERVFMSLRYILRSGIAESYAIGLPF